MSGWSDSELATIGRADEIHIAPDRSDRTPGGAVPIWVVRVGDDLYVRSYRGPSGSWYRRARRNGSGRIRVGGVDHAVRFIAADPGVRTQVDDRKDPLAIADSASCPFYHRRTCRFDGDSRKHST